MPSEATKRVGPRRSRHRVALELAFLVVLVVLVASRAPGFGRFLMQVELGTQDLRYRLRGPLPVSGVCVVGIDDDSLQARAWPWSRDVYARFARQMHGYGARCVLFDILLPEAREAESDAEFAAAMQETGNVVLVFHGQTKKGRSQVNAQTTSLFGYDTQVPVGTIAFPSVLPPIPQFAEAAAGVGHIQIDQGPDGKYRRAYLFVGSLDSDKVFANAALEAFRLVNGLRREEIRYDEGLNAFRLGGSQSVSVDPRCRVELNFPGPDETFPRYSFTSVENGEVPPDKFRDQIVLVGETATGSRDIRPQPFSEELYFGVESNATLVWNLLNDNFLRETSFLTYAATILILGALIGLVVPRLAPIPGGLFALGLAMAYSGLSCYVFIARNTILELTPQVLTIALGFLTITAYRLATEEREKRKVRDTFSLYVSPDVVEEILEDPDRIDLEGDAREITILFSDIVGFTSMSEQLPAKEVVRLLNQYFSVMSDVIFDHQGTIDKFIGDAIMVLFNAPKEQPAHPDLAVRCALAMRQALKQLQDHWSAEGQAGFGIGVGIDTGEAVIGNLGSPTRMQYTAIGDHVNLASRLEGLTRTYETEIIISDSTFRQLTSTYSAREIDKVIVKGRSEPVGIYEVLDFHTPETFPNMQDALEHFSNGMAKYYEGAWQAAIGHFSEVLKLNPDDACSRMYVQRCEQLLAEPPEHWEGVWVMRTK